MNNSPIHSLVAWIPVTSQLPDDDITVLISDVENDVTLGFMDGDSGWRYCSGERVGDPVTHWAHVPAAPSNAKSPSVDEKGK